MDDIDRALSIKLYDVMDQVGVSEKIRKLYQDTAIKMEIIETIAAQIHNNPTTWYIFGSTCEGTTTKGLNSDIDYVVCEECYPVIDDINTAPLGECYLMIRDNHTYPGYVKLQLVRDGGPMTIYNTEIYDDHDTDTEGRVCKTHFTFIEPGDQQKQRNGPADTHPGNDERLARDTVYALRCSTIPICARKWLDRRRRRYHWPSLDNLRKMGDYGCFVVGVGHNSSREAHIEWRLPFSLQERLLMFSLNPTQHKCYVLLKTIKKDVIQAELGECISSYHCKTCLFHAIEVTPAAIWRPDNLVCCVRLCLVILLTWVVNGVCPNYFLFSENMFEKPQVRANRYRLLELFRALIADDNSILLRMQCDDISNRVLQPGILHNNMTDKIVYHQYLNLYVTCRYMNEFSEEIYNLENNVQNIMTSCQHIERLTNTCVIGEHTEQQTRDAISNMIPVLHLHIAQKLASLTCKSQGQEHTRQLLYLSIYHCKFGNHADLMTTRLLLVSLLLRFEKYDLCETLLEDIEHDVKRYVVTKSGCYGKRYVENADLLQHLSTNNMSCKIACKTVYVGCVRFARCDTEIAPLPLQYEMYRSMCTPPGSRHDIEDRWFDLAAVDGKVYLYFLQYLVYTRLNRPENKQVAIDNLVWVLGDDTNLRHTETAYNLLGWIHVQERRIPKALRCFVTSWRIRPGHNAAKFHIMKLLKTEYR